MHSDVSAVPEVTTMKELNTVLELCRLQERVGEFRRDGLAAERDCLRRWDFVDVDIAVAALVSITPRQ